MRRFKQLKRVFSASEFQKANLLVIGAEIWYTTKGRAQKEESWKKVKRKKYLKLWCLQPYF